MKNIPGYVGHQRHQRTHSASSRNGQTTLRIPHTFMVHTYGIPTVCQLCKKLLKGLFKQGLQCRDCQYNTHKKCMDKVPQDCTGEQQLSQLQAEISDGTPPRKDRDNFFREEFDDSDFEDGPSPQASEYGAGKYNNNSKPPPVGGGGGVNLVAGRPREAPKALTNAQNSPPELVNGASGAVGAGGAAAAADGKSSDGQSEQSQSSSSSSPSANIPLMRIVQSVKHTKKRGGQALKEGWLVHYTSLDKALKRYYWRLDSKTITLFISEQGSKYHKELPLAELLSIETHRDPRADSNYCFELCTANLSYYVGQDPQVGEEQPVRLPPPDSGIGADIAKSWETSIRQAYMHVTNTREWQLQSMAKS